MLMARLAWAAWAVWICKPPSAIGRPDASRDRRWHTSSATGRRSPEGVKPHRKPRASGAFLLKRDALRVRAAIA